MCWRQLWHASLKLLLLSAALLQVGYTARRQPPPISKVPIAELLRLGQVPHNTDAGGSPDVSRRQDLQVHQLADSDFVYATGSCRDRMRLARSSRAWRRGIRGFILTDQNQTDSLVRLNAEGAAHNESYAFFPDDEDGLLGGVRHGTMKGDTRAAVAPFAAHRHYGETYKWLLYGDDDTLFFMDAVKRMLSAFNSDLPLAFSDNLWFLGKHPNPHAPRCLPCHTANETLPTLEEIMGTPHVRDGVRQYLAKHKPKHSITEADVDAAASEPREVPGRRFLPRPACPYCTPRKACPLVEDARIKCAPPGAHGGAGMIFSVGLMRRIPLEAALECIQGFVNAPGGDALVSECLWHHGIAFTDPGPLVRHLYDPHFHVFGGSLGLSYLWSPIGTLTQGRCNKKCKWMIRNTLTLHVNGRHFRNWRVSAMHMWGVARAHEAANAFLETVSPSLRSQPYGTYVEEGDADSEAPAASATDSGADDTP